MKILVVLPDASLGGITISAFNFCKECVRRGDEVDMLVMDHAHVDIPSVNQLEIGGLSQYWNLNTDTIKSAGLKEKLLLIPLGLIKRLTNRKDKWLPIIFHGYRVKERYDVAIAYRQCAPCYYFVANCVDADKLIALIHGNLLFMRETRTWDYMFPKFDKIACVSNAVGVDFKEEFPDVADRITTLYNMFDIEDIIAKSKSKSSYTVDPTKTNIITVARHDNAHKKLYRIPEACRELRNRGIEGFHWYIAGDGNDMKYNMKVADKLGVTDLITFCGAVDNPFALLSQCDFSVLTSVTEAFSMSVIESKILCKPQVVMRYIGLEEALIDGEEGLIAEQSISSLCDCISRMMKDKELLLKMTNYLKEHLYSNDKCYAQLLSMIK